MLCQFTVKNFKSIRDEVTFDMQAAAISEHEDRIIIEKDEEKYLPLSAIYGLNGAGKSNVLAAMHTLVAKVLRPLFATEDTEEKVLLQKKIIVEPFAFLESKDEPTEIELFLRTTVSEYRYILHVKRDIVLYESLDRVKLETGRKSALFTRDENGIVLKGAFAKLKVSNELSKTLTLLFYLGIAYKGTYTTQRLYIIDELFVQFHIKKITENAEQKSGRKTLLKSVERIIQRRHSIVHDGDYNEFNRIKEVTPSDLKRIDDLVILVSNMEDIVQNKFKFI